MPGAAGEALGNNVVAEFEASRAGRGGVVEGVEVVSEDGRTTPERRWCVLWKVLWGLVLPGGCACCCCCPATAAAAGDAAG